LQINNQKEKLLKRILKIKLIQLTILFKIGILLKTQNYLKYFNTVKNEFN